MALRNRTNAKFMRSTRSSHFELPAYNLSPQKVTKFLLLVIGLLILFNLGERVIVRWLSAINSSQVNSLYFNFDQESNFPTLYSALALGFSSYLLAIITVIKKSQNARYARHWKALSIIFLILALDEICSLHELSIPFLRHAINAKGILYFTWVVPAFILLIVFLVIFRKFIFSLPLKIKVLFIASGAVYVSGALGMELIGGYIADTYGFNNIFYGIVSSIEEILEMLGIVIFIRGLLTYIQSHLTELHLSLSFQPSVNSSVKNKII